MRAISAETGIPVGAVHRAKRQLEKIVAQQAGQKAAAISRRTANELRGEAGHQWRSARRPTADRLGVRAGRGERHRARAIGTQTSCAEPWTVVSALFASMFDDHAIEWLNKRGCLRWNQRGQAEAIIAAVNAVIGRQR